MAIQMTVGLPEGVLGIGVAIFKGGEDYPTVLALLKDHFSKTDLGENAEMAGEENFGAVTLRQFFPHGRCGVLLKDDMISFAGPGLKGIIGKKAKLVPLDE